MDASDKAHVVSLLEQVADMTIATLREDGSPQATTVSYVSEGLTIYFGTSKRSQKASNIERDGRVSLTINAHYRFWKDIHGLSAAAIATRVTEPAEFRKVSQLLFDKFPRVHEYASTQSEEVALFRVEPVVVSLLDYTKGFGHTTTFDLR